MYCRNCGKQLPDNAQYCDGCGARQVKGGYVTYTQSWEPRPSVTFFDAIRLFFTKYADFSTRSRRSEYWWSVLFRVIAAGLATWILKDYDGIWSLVVLVPSIAISVRRLHDIGKSGTWLLLELIPVVGLIILLIWYCQDSTGDNQWGANPKY